MMIFLSSELDCSCENFSKHKQSIHSNSKDSPSGESFFSMGMMNLMVGYLFGIHSLFYWHYKAADSSFYLMKFPTVYTAPAIGGVLFM